MGLAMRPVILLCGGVGGAKLTLGFERLNNPGALTAVVNTADDFEHLGLHISPDLDTLLYTLSNLADPERGWGRRNETWSFMAALREFGGEDWFALGDGDLAMHALRTAHVAAGGSLTEFSTRICRRLNIRTTVLPMTDNPVATLLDTDAGILPFQHYFVREACYPKVKAIRFSGAEAASCNPALIALLSGEPAPAVILAPSNPLLSIDPILALPGLRERLTSHPGPVIGVSPIVGGMALRGPAAKIMAELGLSPEASTVAEHYADFLDGFVIDRADEAQEAAIAGHGLRVCVTDTVMRTLEDRIALARTCSAFVAEIAQDAAA